MKTLYTLNIEFKDGRLGAEVKDSPELATFINEIAANIKNNEKAKDIVADIENNIRQKVIRTFVEDYSKALINRGGEMMNNKIILLDKQKIEEILAEKKLSKSKISQKMGMGRSFVANCLNRGTMQKSYYALLCYTLGVDFSALMKKESERKTIKVENNEKNYVILCNILKELKTLNEKLENKNTAL